jgi:hypothetical protein
VDPAILQHALDAGIDQFPFYRSIIRRGFFWYYFEKSDLSSRVREEYKPVCAPLYDVNRINLLFELTYFRRRINLEIYHALSDGMGALQFLKTVVFYYLKEKHRETIGEQVLLGGSDASGEQRGADAFDKYYSREKAVKIPILPRAYRIRGERYPEARLGIIEGHVSVAAILQKTRACHATLSEFLTSLLMCSIHEGMTIRDEARPVSITIPVDLRKYYATPSARNFFSVINVSHNFSTSLKSFEDVLAAVRQSFKAQLTAEKIHARINQLSSFEHALPIKVVPLAVKAPILKNAAWKAEQEHTANLSNLGKVSMPRELVPYIRLFDIYNSTICPQICLCSFEDILSISFSSPLESSDIERSFFRALAEFGLDVEIVSNRADTGVQDALLS